MWADELQPSWQLYSDSCTAFVVNTKQWNCTGYSEFGTGQITSVHSKSNNVHFIFFTSKFRPYVMGLMLRGPDWLSICWPRKIMRTGYCEHHDLNLRGKNRLKYEVNLPESLFPSTKEVWFYFSLFSATEHPTMHHNAFAWLNSGWILYFLLLFIFSNWPTYRNFLGFGLHSIKSNRHGFS